MSCYGAGSTSQLSFISEVTRGTTPAGDFTLLPYATHTLGLSKEEITDPTLFGDRMERNTRHGNKTVAGDLSAPLRADNFDLFLASGMMGTWDTSPSSADDELKIGNTLSTFSIEDYDSTVDYSLVYTGCIVNSIGISTSPNGNIDATFGMLGYDLTAPSQTQKTVASTTINEPFDNYSGNISLGDSGGALTALDVVTSIDFTITNNLTPTFVVGSDVANCYVNGTAEVTGSLSVYYKDATILNRFLNETESALSIEMDDSSSGNTYTFLFPRIKLNGNTPPVDGQGERILTVPFRALRDTTEQSSVVIYRPETA